MSDNRWAIYIDSSLCMCMLPYYDHATKFFAFLVTGCTVRRYEQLETSPEMIEQELRPAVCEHQQTDLRSIILQIDINKNRACDSCLFVHIN